MRPSANLTRGPGRQKGERPEPPGPARGPYHTLKELTRRRHRPLPGAPGRTPGGGDEPEFDPELVARAVRFLDPILRRYFRAEVRGTENIPEAQTIVVSHHDGGMLPIDGLLLGSAWHHRFGCKRRLHVLVHDMVLRLFGPWQWVARGLGFVPADRRHLDTVLEGGHSLLIYPGGSRETFRSYWERKTITLGEHTGFVRHALRRRLPITPVVSAGAHETFMVLWNGGWLAERLGFRKLFRADVFPIVAGLPFGVWIGAGIPHFPLPAKLTMQVLPPIDLYGELRERLGRDLSAEDLLDEGLIRRCFDRVRCAMQCELDRLYAERRFPVLG